MPKYSFVVPIYNDAYLAEEFCQEFKKVFAGYCGEIPLGECVELIFVNDGSSDDSSLVLKALSMDTGYPFVKAIELSRNFGQHIALSCGYEHAAGQFVGMLNVDMQEHPDQIPKLLALLESGDYDIVYGLRDSRKGSFADKWTSIFFNTLLNSLTGSKVLMNVSTLRIMNRKFVDAYNALSEKTRYLPGLESWLGFKSGYAPIQHQERRRGKSSYSFRKRMSMAIESIVSFSDLPLRLVALFGAATAFVGFVLGAMLIVKKLLFTDVQPGYTSTLSLIVFLGGVQILVTGIGAIYIGRILKEVQARPLYVIRQTFNF